MAAPSCSLTCAICLPSWAASSRAGFELLLAGRRCARAARPASPAPRPRCASSASSSRQHDLPAVGEARPAGRRCSCRSISIAPSRLLTPASLRIRSRMAALCCSICWLSWLSCKLPVAERLLALVDLPAVLFQLGGQPLRASRSRLPATRSTSASLVSATASRSAVERLDLLGDLLQAAARRTAAAAGPTAWRALACTSSYSTCWRVLRQRLELLALVGQLVLLAGQIAGGIVEAESGVFLLGRQRRPSCVCWV